MSEKFKRGGIAAAIISAALFFVTSPPATAEIVNIANNPGGYIGNYMFQLNKHRKNGDVIKFTGSCDSACTLLMAMPRDNTCITRKTVFRFHAPMARSANTREAALQFMMATYPDWVSKWIDSQGGLTRELISMNYTYAKKFMQTCDQMEASRQ